jgi:polar amino acid transport system substrate-binding protein
MLTKKERKVKTSSKILICALVLVLCAAFAFAAPSDKAYVVKKGTLVVGITDFAPMDYKEGNKWIGFDADMANAFAKYLGVKCEFIEIDWDSKSMELANKTIDCVWNGMTLTDGVKKAMATSNPYCNNAQIIVTKKGIASSLKKAADAKKLKFAVEAGSAGEEAAKENGYKAMAVDTQAAAVMEVAAGTSEACIIDSLMAAAMVGPGTSYPDLTYSVALTTEEYGVGFRKDSDLVPAINDFFKKAYADGSMMKTAEKYGTQASIIPQK